jgi:hypothetical protein
MHQTLLQMYIDLHGTARYCFQILNFLEIFSKNPLIQHFTKIRPVPACVASRRHDEANSRWSQFCRGV